MQRGCPVPESLFSALEKYFKDVDFTWRPWLVGGNVTVGFGIPGKIGDERARKAIKELLGWIVQRRTNDKLGQHNLSLLYDVGQRTIGEWYGNIRGDHWKGSPKKMIKFAYPQGPEGGWDDSRFGLNKERQSAFRYKLKSLVSEEEIDLVGWDREMEELGPHSLALLDNGRWVGETTCPEADIWLSSRKLVVDVLGEDHFDMNVKRSKDRDPEEHEHSFLRKQEYDRQRWKMCWSARYNVIAIGPNLQIDTQGLERFADLFALVQGESPSFQSIGFPEDFTLPEFERDDGGWTCHHPLTLE